MTQLRNDERLLQGSHLMFQQWIFQRNHFDRSGVLSFCLQPAATLQEVLPKAGLVYSEKGNLSEVFM